MATDKKGFIIYCDLIHTVKKLPKEKQGDLFMHLLEYVNDLNPVTDDLLIELAFEPIKQQLKRDLKDWESKKLKRSEAGKLGGQARVNNLKQNQALLEDVKQNQANQAVIVNDNVNVTVNVNDIKDIHTFDFKKSCIDFGFKSDLVIDWLKVRKNKRLTNTETAFKKFIKQIELNGNDKNLILEKCIEKSWGGFESDWFKKEEKQVINNPYKISM